MCHVIRFAVSKVTTASNDQSVGVGKDNPIKFSGRPCIFTFPQPSPFNHSKEGQNSLLIMLQLMAKEQKKRPNEREKREMANGRRRGKSAHFYKQYVGKSNIFGETHGTHWQNGRWPGKNTESHGQGTAIRMSDSNPTPAQLEWQRQRRARAMSASGASTTSGFSTGSGGIVQRHAEMRSYLQHCQRVLNARARVDSSVSAPKRLTRPNSTMAPFAVNTLEKRRMSNNGPNERMGRRTTRAKSVPTSGKNEQQIKEDNERLLNRLLQIGLRSPPRYASFSASKRKSKGEK